MARSVPIWKILRFAKVSLYLERFVPRHATAHIHNVARHLKQILLFLKIYPIKRKSFFFVRNFYKHENTVFGCGISKRKAKAVVFLQTF